MENPQEKERNRLFGELARATPGLSRWNSRPDYGLSRFGKNSK